MGMDIIILQNMAIRKVIILFTQLIVGNRFLQRVQNQKMLDIIIHYELSSIGTKISEMVILLQCIDLLTRQIESE